MNYLAPAGVARLLAGEQVLAEQVIRGAMEHAVLTKRVLRGDQQIADVVWVAEQ
ncbi:MAG: hypothetical protein IPP47_33185 [Bryobacterales bacterium]|nr:hypothetical protein [Bryobacterales bacterium]